MKNLKKQLIKIIDTTENDLTKHVARYVVEHCSSNQEIKDFFNDLSRGGCTSMIGELIYYEDTKAFFDKFEIEIEKLKEDLEESTGEPLRIKGRITNWLALFGFEQTAQNLAIELEIF